MTKTDLHRLVDDLPEDVVDGTARFLRRVLERRVDPDQLWFWTSEWQAKEREVDARLARGERGTIQHSNQEFLAALDSRSEQLDA